MATKKDRKQPLDPKPSGDFAPPTSNLESHKIGDAVDPNAKPTASAVSHETVGECRLCGKPVTKAEEYRTFAMGVAHVACFAVPAAIGQAHAAESSDALPKRIKLLQPFVVYADHGPQHWGNDTEVSNPDEIHFLTRVHTVQHEILER